MSNNWTPDHAASQGANHASQNKGPVNPNQMTSPARERYYAEYNRVKQGGTPR